MPTLEELKKLHLPYETTEAVCKHVAEEEVPGIKAKSKKFLEKGAAVYVKA